MKIVDGYHSVQNKERPRVNPMPEPGLLVTPSSLVCLHCPAGQMGSMGLALLGQASSSIHSLRMAVMNFLRQDGNWLKSPKFC